MTRGRKPTKVTGQRVVQSFGAYYTDATGDTFYPSYAMIRMADKLADFYTLPRLLDGMRYFFEVKHRSNYFEFINSLDTLFREMDNTSQDLEYFANLEEETKRLMASIRDQKIGEDD